MGQAIGQVLSFGVGVALSPVPIIAVVLMLATPQGRVNGPAFLIGAGFSAWRSWGLVVACRQWRRSQQGGAPQDWVSIVKIVLGVLLLLLAARQWRGRPRGDTQPELPTWMKTIDTLTPPKALGMEILLSAANPKNTILVVGAAAAIAQTGVDTADQTVALAVFVALGTLGPGIPVGIYFLMRDRPRRSSRACAAGWRVRMQPSWAVSA